MKNEQQLQLAVPTGWSSVGRGFELPLAPLQGRVFRFTGFSSQTVTEAMAFTARGHPWRLFVPDFEVGPDYFSVLISREAWFAIAIVEHDGQLDRP